MESYQRDLFTTLINKLRLDDSDKCFQNGALNELVIHEISNRWSFSFTLDHLMPYETFKAFDTGIKKLFKNASLYLVFKVRNSELNEALVKTYWPWVVKNCGLSTVMTEQLSEYGKLKIVNHKIALSSKNEALRDFLINGALVQIEDCYYRLGFPRFKVHILGGAVKLPTKIVDFKIQKNDDDIKLARSAAEALDRDSHK